MKSSGAIWHKPRLAMRYGPPVVAFLAMLAAWEAYVRLRDVPPYILPAPSLVLDFASGLARDPENDT